MQKEAVTHMVDFNPTISTITLSMSDLNIPIKMLSSR